MENNKESKSEALIIKDFFVKVFSYKYFYLVCIIICLASAYIINKYSPTVYEITSRIGPVEDRRSAMLGGSGDLFTGSGSYRESRNLENDIVSLNSFTLVSQTLTDLNLEVGYFREKITFFGNDQQYYPDSPIRVFIDKSHVQPVNAMFYVEILSDSTFRLKSSEEDVSLYNYIDDRVVSANRTLNIDRICRFNETISDYNYQFSVSLNREKFSSESEDERPLYFQFYPLENLTMNYLGRLKVEPVNIRSSLINVSFSGENLNLTVAFLNRYLQNYLNENLFKKNHISINTMNFIDSQISEISDDLVTSESRLRDFRSTHQVTDLSYQGRAALEQMSRLEAERSSLQVQERYYNYILDYFSKNEDMAGLAPPSSANVSDPIMNQLIMELLSLNTQRSSILSDNTQKHLFLPQIENQIRLQKRAIIENVSNNLNTLELNKNELNYREERLTREIANLPRTELNMVSMQRQFTLSDAIYTFLLQRRSEAAITMASNYPDFEILEPARHVARSILSPRTTLNWALAFFIALLIPSVFIILKDLFSEKLTSVHEIQLQINKPVLGTIYSNSLKTEAVVAEAPRSSVAESFRILRSNLLTKLRPEPSKVILVTSPQPKDGKSFISFNLATAIASAGYKTVILDADFHKPNLYKKLKEDNTPGLSNYLTNHISEEELIHNTPIENLSFIPAGPILANHAELIEAGKLDDLVEFLKSIYQYIIIDTTPAGLLSDTSVLMKYATHLLLICRNNFTRKSVLNDVIKMFIANKTDNFDVVYNDIDLKKSYYGRYNSYFKKEKQKLS